MSRDLCVCVHVCVCVNSPVHSPAYSMYVIDVYQSVE